MIDLTGLTEQAEAERARYRAALGRLTGDHHKRAAALLVERKRHEAAVDELRKAAEDAIEAGRAAIAQQRAAEVERLRALVGDVVLVHLYERWIERMNARERAALVRDAAVGWERAIVGALVDGLTLPTAAALVDAERTAAAITPEAWPQTWPGDKQ